MSASDWIALGATAIAAGGLVVSITSLVKSSRTEKRQAEREEQQARLMQLQIAELEEAAGDRFEKRIARILSEVPREELAAAARQIRAARDHPEAD